MRVAACAAAGAGGCSGGRILRPLCRSGPGGRGGSSPGPPLPRAAMPAWIKPLDASHRCRGAGRTWRVLALQSCSRGRRAEKFSTAPEIAKFCPSLAAWPSPLVASCWCVNEGALTSSGDGRRSSVLCSLLPEPSTIQHHSKGMVLMGTYTCATWIYARNAYIWDGIPHMYI